MLAGLGAIARDNSHALRQNIVDFDDGTYGVRLGTSFYRVDNYLPATSSTSTTPVYASFGSQSSMWAAIAEKAFAHHTGANSYASLNGGYGDDVNRAFGSSSAGWKYFIDYGSAANLVNDIATRVTNRQAVSVAITWRVGAGVSLVGSHAYTVSSVAKNASGVVTSITLYNPHHVDGGGNVDGSNDGFVTITPSQLYSCAGYVNWGLV